MFNQLTRHANKSTMNFTSTMFSGDVVSDETYDSQEAEADHEEDSASDSEASDGTETNSEIEVVKIGDDSSSEEEATTAPPAPPQEDEESEPKDEAEEDKTQPQSSGSYWLDLRGSPLIDSRQNFQTVVEVPNLSADPRTPHVPSPKLSPRLSPRPSPRPSGPFDVGVPIEEALPAPLSDFEDAADRDGDLEASVAAMLDEEDARNALQLGRESPLYLTGESDDEPEAFKMN